MVLLVEVVGEGGVLREILVETCGENDEPGGDLDRDLGGDFEIALPSTGSPMDLVGVIGEVFGGVRGDLEDVGEGDCFRQDFWGPLNERIILLPLLLDVKLTSKGRVLGVSLVDDISSGVFGTSSPLGLFIFWISHSLIKTTLKYGYI